MSSTSNHLSEPLRTWLGQVVATRESAVLRRLRAATAELPMARMQISPEQGRLMALLVRMLGARRCLEVGVFTGYSSIVVASVLPPDGKLVACDVSDDWTDFAKPFWHDAGVADRIDLRLGLAAETLAALIAEGEEGSYDFAFLDADKVNQEDYYEKCLVLLRPGGVVAVDNAFLGGRVAEKESDDEAAPFVRRLVEKVFADERVEPALVPIGDGLLLAWKAPRP